MPPLMRSTWKSMKPPISMAPQKLISPSPWLPVELAEHHRSPLRRPALPPDHLLRPGRGPAPPAHPAVGDRVDRAGARLLHGGRADLPVGGQPPGDGEAGRPIVGSSRTSEHNQVFLNSLRATLTLDPAFRGGEYSPDARPTAGMRAFARIYAGWGLSQAFYWEREYRTMGYSSLEDFLVGFWEGFWLDRDRDPNNLLAMLWTWEHGDVGRTPGFDGDTEAALRSIRCPVLAMPARTDLYFPPEDEEWASQFIRHGEVRVLDTIWGHFAGLGMNAADNAVIDRTLGELLDRPA